MRDILFRGKAKGTDQWLYGDLTHYGKDGAQIWPRDENAERWNYVVDPDTIGQFTGLYDKNGTKIFEGDIAESRYNSRSEIYLEEIVFRDCSFYAREVGTKHLTSLLKELFSNSVVVGNIHDNPELLKGGAE